jgi:hypothetical protein
MKKTILFLMLAVAFFGFGFKGCGGKKSTAVFKPNRAELGENWELFKHDASFTVWNFKGARPAEHRSPQQARVFWNGEVTGEEMSLIEQGLSETFVACEQESKIWFTQPVWNYFYFNKIPDYKIIQVPSNYTLTEGAEAGCAGMTTCPHGVCTAAGTVGGLNDRINNSTPGSRGGVYIIIPKQSPEQLARPECKQLMKNAVRNEAEHVVFTNVPQLFFAYANDAVPPNGTGHPYCNSGSVSAYLQRRYGLLFGR